MSQKADEGLSHLGQKTPNAPEKTLSEMSIAQMSFCLNQSSVVCLPLVSDSQRLIWVSSNEINLQLDGAAELSQAFDQFPYLTQKQTAALAQRCSLHPDQVKVWFMAQRLRYGISWDYKDIPIVRTKMSGQGKEELQNRAGEEEKEDGGENKKRKGEVTEPAGKKAREVREEQSASEGRMMGENVRSSERLEIEMKPEQPKKKDKGIKEKEDKGNTQKKRKTTTVTDKMGKKRAKQEGEGVKERTEGVEIRSEGAEKETTHFTRKKKKSNKISLSVQEWPAHRSFVVPDELLDAPAQHITPSQTRAFDAPPLSDIHTELLERVEASTSNIPMSPVTSGFEENESTGHTSFVTDVDKLKELLEASSILVADEVSPTVTEQQDSHVSDAPSLPSRVRFKAKTPTQLAMMKAAFSNCQYPDVEDYNRLAKVIDIPRYLLVQWFGDMRYYVKKFKPRWLTEEQYSQALANIRYRQYLSELVKLQAGEATWKIKLHGSETCGEEEKLPAPPDEKQSHSL